METARYEYGCSANVGPCGIMIEKGSLMPRTIPDRDSSRSAVAQALFCGLTLDGTHFNANILCVDGPDYGFADRQPDFQAALRTIESMPACETLCMGNAATNRTTMPHICAAA